MITNSELVEKLDTLLKLPFENETVEFKEAKHDFDSRKLGKYFSAISNEANLSGKAYGWLIFGVEDKSHKIVGTAYRKDSGSLHKLKGELATKTTNNISFSEIFEVIHPDGRVIMFKIPAAPKGIPIAYHGHYYARDGEELTALNIEKL